jgi:probable phosphoglycerate mutase
LAARVFPLIKELDGANALLVTHGGICRMIRSYFEDMDNEEFVQFSQGNCEVRIYP